MEEFEKGRQAGSLVEGCCLTPMIEGKYDEQRQANGGCERECKN
jgi:hypothetical protein